MFALGRAVLKHKVLEVSKKGTGTVEVDTSIGISQDNTLFCCLITNKTGYLKDAREKADMR